MANEKMGCAIFAIAAVLLAMSTLNIFTKDNFTAINDPSPNQNVVPRYSSGPSLQSTKDIENYQDKIVMNTGTSLDNVNSLGAQYYSNLSNYLIPSIDNLELAQNMSGRSAIGGISLPGAANSYSNVLGDGYSNNLGTLNGVDYPAVNYKNDRASQLSQCAKDLPMFAASSLLPKPSVNANNNALSQSAARALAAFTALSPVEQIGAITNNNTPYSKSSDFRATVPIDYNKTVDVVFGGSSATGTSTVYGQVNSVTGKSAPSGFASN